MARANKQGSNHSTYMVDNNCLACEQSSFSQEETQSPFLQLTISPPPLGVGHLGDDGQLTMVVAQWLSATSAHRKIDAWDSGMVGCSQSLPGP